MNRQVCILLLLLLLSLLLLLLLLLLLTDEHITIRNKQGAIDLRTTGFLK